MGDPKDHLRSFKQISENTINFEDDYISCLNDIKDDEYNQNHVDECVGKEFMKVVMDVRYESMKVMSKSETKLKDFFIKHCYSLAGVDPIYTNACDILERDVLDFMWNGINFVKIVEINRWKYMYEYAEMPKATLKHIVAYLKLFAGEFFTLLNEVDAHKEKTIMRIQAMIKERSEILLEQSGTAGAAEPQMIHETLTVEEPMSLPGEENYEQTHETNEEHTEEHNEDIVEVSGRKLPSNQVQLGNPQDYIIPNRKLVKANSATAQKLKESGVKMFNHHGKYSGLNSPNYNNKKQDPASKYALNGVLPGLGRYENPRDLKLKNVHTSYVKHQRLIKKEDK